ncbi:hypothetical protein WN944_022606 [Citrus x changshan-huyou]|uniref:Uncharacterized protein n=1 Tax=Citrus x changshan-huyou TaxID=2935761 RepID=A0AAP0N1T0_9ROSI
MNEEINVRGKSKPYLPIPSLTFVSSLTQITSNRSRLCLLPASLSSSTLVSLSRKSPSSPHCSNCSRSETQITQITIIVHGSKLLTATHQQPFTAKNSSWQSTLPHPLVSSHEKSPSSFTASSTIMNSCCREEIMVICVRQRQEWKRKGWLGVDKAVTGCCPERLLPRINSEAESIEQEVKKGKYFSSGRLGKNVEEKIQEVKEYHLSDCRTSNLLPDHDPSPPRILDHDPSPLILLDHDPPSMIF